MLEEDIYIMRRKQRIHLALEIISGILCMVGLIAFAVICVAGSGYHWE